MFNQNQFVGYLNERFYRNVNFSSMFFVLPTQESKHTALSLGIDTNGDSLSEETVNLYVIGCFLLFLLSLTISYDVLGVSNYFEIGFDMDFPAIASLCITRCQSSHHITGHQSSVRETNLDS